MASLARSRAVEAERRREEADLAAELARVLLGEASVAEALPVASARLAAALDLPYATIALEPGGGGAVPLGGGAELRVPADLPPDATARLRERVAPALEALLAAALDRDRLQAEVVETQALRRSDVIKTALLRAVSHDLRTPLTAILAAGDAVRSPAIEPAEREELGAVVVEEAERLSRLIDKLLDLSRLQAGEAEARRDWCSIEEVVEGALEHVDPSVPVEASLDRDLPLVRADPVQLERVFANLIENAQRFSGGHPVKLRARVTGGRLMIRVIDRGPGIPAELLPHVFEPFRRGDGEAAHRGSGLGLAIVKGFVEANDGRVWAESLPGQGTVFVVELPLADRAGGARMSGGPRVLVCDDEPQIVRALKVVLREAGFTVEATATAQEALDAAAVRPPDAAVIDLMLPDGSGIEVCRELRSWSRVPIVVLSAIGDEDQKVAALEAGADDYVTKPFGPRELVARLHAVMRRAGAAVDEPAIAVDGLEIDLAARVVRRDGAEVHLTPIEYDLLRTLARNRGRLLTHRALLTRGVGPGYADDTQVLRTHVANLRRKIEPEGGPRYIRTDPGVGYRFAG